MKTITNRYAMTYSINNGGSFSAKPYYYSALGKAVADGKAIVRGSHQPQMGNKSYVTVTDTLTGKAAYEGLLWGRRENFVDLTDNE